LSKKIRGEPEPRTGGGKLRPISLPDLVGIEATAVVIRMCMC